MEALRRSDQTQFSIFLSRQLDQEESLTDEHQLKLIVSHLSTCLLVRLLRRME